MTLCSPQRRRAPVVRLVVASMLFVCVIALAALDGTRAWAADGRLAVPETRASRVLAARARPQLPAGREVLTREEGLMIALPPILATGTGAASSVSPVPLPVVFMLHGMCGQPSWSCDALGGAGRDQSWLACPAGNVGCGDHFDWKGDGETKAAHIDAASKNLRARHPELVAPEGNDVLVGFSRGAFVARDVAYARPGRFVGLVLIGAAMLPDPERLKASGIRRVVLASGDFDSARSMMVKATAKLLRGGIEARFVSTGRIYHQLPGDLAEIMAPHIAWVRAAPAAGQGA